ncbi:hypothetical protein AX16_003930 [Volvariella volvacea WC 439]|nr:hypothetical protein AX16_003930 [Volvariella volvacea WC 439]
MPGLLRSTYSGLFIPSSPSSSDSQSISDSSSDSETDNDQNDASTTYRSPRPLYSPPAPRYSLPPSPSPPLVLPPPPVIHLFAVPAAPGSYLFADRNPISPPPSDDESSSDSSGSGTRSVQRRRAVPGLAWPSDSDTDSESDAEESREGGGGDDDVRPGTPNSLRSITVVDLPESSRPLSADREDMQSRPDSVLWQESGPSPAGNDDRDAHEVGDEDAVMGSVLRAGEEREGERRGAELHLEWDSVGEWTEESESESESESGDEDRVDMPDGETLPSRIQVQRDVEIDVEPPTPLENPTTPVVLSQPQPVNGIANNDDSGSNSDSNSDSIVLSDLVRAGEASRLRRRGAMRIDHSQSHGFGTGYGPAGAHGLGLSYGDVFGWGSSSGGSAVGRGRSGRGRWGSEGNHSVHSATRSSASPHSRRGPSPSTSDLQPRRQRQGSRSRSRSVDSDWALLRQQTSRPRDEDHEADSAPGESGATQQPVLVWPSRVRLTDTLSRRGSSTESDRDEQGAGFTIGDEVVPPLPRAPLTPPSQRWRRPLHRSGMRSDVSLSMSRERERKDDEEYVLVCGGGHETSRGVAASTAVAGAWKPSPLPLAGPSTSRTTFSSPKASSPRSMGGCGAIIHGRATPRCHPDSPGPGWQHSHIHRHRSVRPRSSFASMASTTITAATTFRTYDSDDEHEQTRQTQWNGNGNDQKACAWIAKSRATENVVKMEEEYVDWEELDLGGCVRPYGSARRGQSGNANGIVGKTGCGCVREVVGCRNCGNPLGIRYKPCGKATRRIDQHHRGAMPPISPEGPEAFLQPTLVHAPTRSPPPMWPRHRSRSPPFPVLRTATPSSSRSRSPRQTLPQIINRISGENLTRTRSPSSRSSSELESEPESPGAFKTREVSPLRPEGPRYWDMERTRAARRGESETREPVDGDGFDYDLERGSGDEGYDSCDDVDGDWEGVGDRSGHRRGQTVYYFYTFFGRAVTGQVKTRDRSVNGTRAVAAGNSQAVRSDSRIRTGGSPRGAGRWRARRRSVSSDPSHQSNQASVETEGTHAHSSNAVASEQESSPNELVFDETRYRSTSPNLFSAPPLPLPLIRPPLRRSDRHQSEPNITSQSSFVPRGLLAAGRTTDTYTPTVHVQGQLTARPQPRRRRGIWMEFDESGRVVPWGHSLTDSHSDNVDDNHAREEPFIPPREAELLRALRAAGIIADTD